MGYLALLVVVWCVLFEAGKRIMVILYANPVFRHYNNFSTNLFL